MKRRAITCQAVVNQRDKGPDEQCGTTAIFETIYNSYPLCSHHETLSRTEPLVFDLGTSRLMMPKGAHVRRL